MTKKLVKIKNAVFDWSGTLFNDHDVSFRATQETVRYFSGKTISKAEYKKHFTIPVKNFYRRYSQVPFAKIDRYYFDVFEKYACEGNVYSHAKELFHYLKKNRVRISILSTVRQDLLEKLLTLSGLHQFVQHVSGSIPDKKKYFPEHLRACAAKKNETIYFGDMDHDIIAANRNGVFSAALIHGYHDQDRLLQARPRLVFSSLQEVLVFFQKWFNPLPKKNPADKPVVTVGGLIRNRKGEVLLLLTHKWSYLYGIPGGKIERGEDALEALRREMLEETDLAVKVQKSLAVLQSINSNEFYIKGQHQILLNYLVSTTGNHFKLNDEAICGLWVRPEQALKLPLNIPTRELLRIYLAGIND